MKNLGKICAIVGIVCSAYLAISAALADNSNLCLAWSTAAAWAGNSLIAEFRISSFLKK